MQSRSHITHVAHVFTAVLITAVFIRIFVIDSFTVSGDSMAPTIQDGDYVFVMKAAYRFSPPERGDIVVGEFRDMAGKKAIKRIVGLPGEWIYIEDGSIWKADSREGDRSKVGELDAESYTNDFAEVYEYRLDPYEYFIVGDNGLGSVDSRDLGPVDIYSIDGNVVGSFRKSDFSFELF